MRKVAVIYVENRKIREMCTTIPHHHISAYESYLRYAWPFVAGPVGIAIDFPSSLYEELKVAYWYHPLYQTIIHKVTILPTSTPYKPSPVVQ